MKQCSKQTSIYVIGFQDFWKIGIAYDPERRLRDLQIGNPFDLTVAREYKLPFDLAYSIEQSMRTVLKNNYKRGEWFQGPVELITSAVEAEIKKQAGRVQVCGSAEKRREVAAATDLIAAMLG